MALIPRDGGPRHRIEITEDIDPNSVGDWYEIRTMLGYHSRMQADTAAMFVKVPASRLDRLETGEQFNPDEMVTIQMNTADVNHLKLSVWLMGWSHADAINSNTIRRMPLSHAQAVLRAIREYEKFQGGPSKNSPLADDLKPLPASTS